MPNNTHPNVKLSVRIVSDRKGSRLLRRQPRRQSQGGNDRNESADQHHQARRNVPMRGIGAGAGLSLASVRVGQAFKPRAVIGRRRRELVKDFREAVRSRDCFRP